MVKSLKHQEAGKKTGESGKRQNNCQTPLSSRNNQEVNDPVSHMLYVDIAILANCTHEPNEFLARRVAVGCNSMISSTQTHWCWFPCGNQNGKP